LKGDKARKEKEMPDNLALRMRPRTIDQVIGQQHLVGEGKIIRRMVEANRLSSMILYGPPGIGKTSIASAIAGTTLMQRLTVKNAYKKSQRRPNFLVAWSCSWTRSIASIKLNKIFSCLCSKVVWSS